MKNATQHDTLDAGHLRTCPECDQARWKRVNDFATAWIATHEGVAEGARRETARPPAMRSRKVA